MPKVHQIVTVIWQFLTVSLLMRDVAPLAVTRLPLRWPLSVKKRAHLSPGGSPRFDEPVNTNWRGERRNHDQSKNEHDLLNWTENQHFDSSGNSPGQLPWQIHWVSPFVDPTAVFGCPFLVGILIYFAKTA